MILQDDLTWSYWNCDGTTCLAVLHRVRKGVIKMGMDVDIMDSELEPNVDSEEPKKVDNVKGIRKKQPQKKVKERDNKNKDNMYPVILVCGFFVIILVAFLANRFISAADAKLVNDVVLASKMRAMNLGAQSEVKKEAESEETEEISKDSDMNGKYIEITKGDVKIRIYDDGTIIDSADLDSDSEPKPENVVYLVKKGDTLSKVSGSQGASVDSIAKLNEIEDINVIYTGESLIIPSQEKLDAIFNEEDEIIDATMGK